MELHLASFALGLVVGGVFTIATIGAIVIRYTWKNAKAARALAQSLSENQTP